MRLRFPMAARAALLILLGLAGTAAAAQRSSAVRLDSAPNTAEGIRALHDFSVCVARRALGETRRVLATDFRTDAYRSRIRRLATDNSVCAPRRSALRFSQLLFAGGLAEHMMRSRLARAELAAYVADQPARGALEARDETEMMALCTVRATPDRVAALFQTEAASDAEAAILRELTPQFGRCLAEGVRMTSNRIGLRSLLALAAYRLAEHNLSTASR